MDYKQFNVQVVIRVIIIALLGLMLAYSIFIRNWFFTPLVTGILFVAACIELVRHVAYYRRSLNNFLIAIRQSGFNASFPVEKSKDNELFETFNEIIRTFQELSLKNETQYQFLNTLTENIQAGIIAFGNEGTIKWINPEAKNLIMKPGITSLTELGKFQPELAAELQTLSPGKKKILRLPGQRDYIEVSMQVTKISAGGEMITIGLLQNIHREMEIKEVEAWQKLTRVMRHEIMNSMTPIVSLTEAVNQVISSRDNLSVSDPDFIDIKESLNTIENRSKGLIKFVNAYKDFSQVPELSISDINLIDLLSKVKALFEQDLVIKEVTLKMDIKPVTMKIKADPGLFEQVLINLVKNSLESFESPGGIISIFCRVDKDRYLIKISDNGPGVDEQVLDRIFIPFYTTKKEGSGIGLSLSRQIIQLHGGTITASSTKGAGTIFFIEL